MSNYQLFHNDLPSKVLESFKGDISIDTETLGLNIKRDRLCLIQLRNETDKKVYLIKFDEDLSPKFSKNIKLLEVKKALFSRDKKDRSRRFSPLQRHPDAVVVDTGKLNKQAMLIKMINNVEKVLLKKYGNRRN